MNGCEGEVVAGGQRAQILSIVVFNAICYFLIGLPLAVFPSFVRFNLGYGAALAGTVIGLQYLATLLTRSMVGRISDTKGPKSAVTIGLGFAAANGVCILAAAFAHSPLAAMLWLVASRLLLGTAESGTGTGCIAWGIGRCGGAATAEVISWNGVASYGGIAAGAPAGVMLMHLGGLPALAAAAILLPILGLAGAARSKGSALAAGVRMSMFHIARTMIPYGLCLTGGSIGFGAIVSFIALDYAAFGWVGAAYALSAFGLSFVLVRFVLSGCIRRYGGFATAMVSLATEAAGLLLLWIAPAPMLALLGAGLSGAGFSLVFPALAVEGLHHVPAASRGAAIAVFTIFLDLALGLTGPGAGFIAGGYGYAAVFLAAAVIVIAALVLTWALMLRGRTQLVDINING